MISFRFFVCAGLCAMLLSSGLDVMASAQSKKRSKLNSSSKHKGNAGKKRSKKAGERQKGSNAAAKNDEQNLRYKFQPRVKLFV
jgi:hypothetical protein